MNYRAGLILTFRYISKLKKGDVFAIDHNGKATEYYTFEGFNEGQFQARTNTTDNLVSWNTDFRIIEVKEIDRILN